MYREDDRDESSVNERVDGHNYVATANELIYPMSNRVDTHHIPNFLLENIIILTN